MRDVANPTLTAIHAPQGQWICRIGFEHSLSALRRKAAETNYEQGSEFHRKSFDDNSEMAFGVHSRRNSLAQKPETPGRGGIGGHALGSKQALKAWRRLKRSPQGEETGRDRRTNLG